MTLVQVMVASGAGMALSMALGTFFVNSSRGTREDVNLSAMLDELSYATGQLTLDLEMAGFWAQAHDPSTIERDGTLAVGTDCGPLTWTDAAPWAFKDRTALAMLDNTTGADAHAGFSCLTAADVVDGTDVIAIKRVLGRVAGTDTDSSKLQSGTVYLRTHERFGTLYLRGSGTPAAVDTPYRDWEYAPAIYFVQKFAVHDAESPRIPTLCRMVLRTSGGGPSFERECVAQGIEDLQLEIGVDSDEDGGADYFAAAPTAADLSRATRVKLYLRARTQRPDLDYRNDKVYQIGNSAAFKAEGADVHYFRKTLSSEVALRNPRALQGVAVQ